MSAVSSAKVGSVLRRRRSMRRIVRRVLLVILASALAFFVLVPVGVAVFGGLRTHAELLRDPFSWPSEWQVQNYTSLLSSGDFWRMVLNSVVIGLGSTFGVLVLSTLAAYVFARLRFPGKEVYYNFFVLGFFFPMAVAILPLYLIVRDLKMLDTFRGIILPQIAFGLPSTILILRRFFAQVPRELEEAALIDGASYLQMFFYIFVPLMTPALSAVSVLSLVGSWNSFFWPLLVLNTESKYTVPLGVMQFSTQYGGLDLGQVLAYVSLSMVPMLIFYLFAERYIVAGLTAGAFKG